ncbi:hypothetical protein BC940DRAFT_290837 [Gongronella butleri]|nr:hypothetical protein BC940DRAFT_290837 [Gongronella butleri]
MSSNFCVKATQLPRWSQPVGLARARCAKSAIPASRPRAPPVSDETKQKIKELLLDGSLSMHKVAQMCNVSMCTVSRVQFVNGLPCSRAIYDNAVLQRVKEELTKGTTLKKVAETCNVTLRFVRQVKLRYGLNDAHPSGNPLTSQKIDQIKACLLGGLSHAETKELCGVSRGAPSIIRKKYKIDFPCAIKYASVAKQKN